MPREERGTRALIFGANGMIGGAVLRECLDDERVASVVCVGRRPSGLAHARLQEIEMPDLFALERHRDQVAAFDVCFYCVGISATGLSERAYARISHDLTMSVVDVLTGINPQMTFCYTSAQGADGSERGRIMWARVKGRTENALLARPFTTYVFRPGLVQPQRGVRSRTRSYRVLYALSAPLLPWLRRRFPRHATTSVELARSMLRAATEGYERPILETEDINRLGAER